MLVLWLCATLVVLQDVVEEAEGFPMNNSTLTEITTI